MVIDGGVAELGMAATLEPARGRGCQTALLRRRIVDAAEAGCHTLFVETGERVPDRPSTSYRNILRAGFEEAYLRPNWGADARNGPQRGFSVTSVTRGGQCDRAHKRMFAPARSLYTSKISDPEELRP